MFRGSFTAMVTPFRNGGLDEHAFRELVGWQIAEGTDGLVPVGTTGESPTLSHEEHHKVVEWCVEEAKGRVPVIAGAGSNSTTEAVELAKHAEKAKADAVLVVTPYYNKPSQEGIYRHFKAINDAIGIPIFVYNIPGRCGIEKTLHCRKWVRCKGSFDSAKSSLREDFATLRMTGCGEAFGATSFIILMAFVSLLKIL